MKRNYVKISGDGQPLEGDLIDGASRAIMLLVQNLKRGGTITMRGNVYQIEAEWRPPSTYRPKRPAIDESEVAQASDYEKAVQVAEDTASVVKDPDLRVIARQAVLNDQLRDK